MWHLSLALSPPCLPILVDNMAKVHSVNAMLGLEAMVMVANAAVAAGDAIEAGDVGGKALSLCYATLTPIMSTRTTGLSMASSGFPSME